MRLRAAAYARISMKHEKSGINVEKTADQFTLIDTMAEHLNADVVVRYVDDGISAKESGIRPDFDRMLGDIPKGGFDIILATEESRLARNMAEKNGIMLACAGQTVVIHTHRDGKLDPSNAQGQFMGNIRGAVDAFEVARKAERQIAENANQRDKGRPFRSGARPFGFLDDRLTAHPVEAALIRQGVHDILQGVSLSRVTAAWRKSDVKPPRAAAWSNISVRSILTKWSIAGVVEHDDVPVNEGVPEWERIVTRAELEAVRAILLAPKSVARRSYARTMLSGLAECHCGLPMVSNGSPSQRARAGRSATYVCSSRVRGVRRDDIQHAGVATDVLERLAAEAVFDVYLMRPESSGTADAEVQELAELHTELAKAEAAARRLQDHFFGDDNALTAAEFKRRNAENQDRIRRAQEGIDNRVSASAHAAMLVKSHERLATLTAEFRESRPAISRYFEVRTGARPDVEAAWKALDLHDQRALVAANLKIVVAPGRGTDRITITRKSKITEKASASA